MTFAGMNYFAVVVAAIAAFLFGGLYYRVLGPYWIKAVGITKKNLKTTSSTPLIITIIAELIMAWVLAGLIAHLGPGQITVRNGVESAAFVWLGFVITTLAVNNAFAMRKPMLNVIDGAHWLGVLLIIGAVIGAFGV